MDGTGKKTGLKALPLKARIGIGAGCVLLAAGIGCGAAIAAQQPQQAAQPQAQEQQAEDQAQKQRVAIKVDMGDWDAAGATALIVHVTGDGVDFYTALDGNGEAQVDLEPGDYDVAFVPSIGADGSLLKVGEAKKLSVGGASASVSAKADKAEAADVSKDDIAAAMDQIAAAVKNGDATLKGDAGRKLLEAAKANAAANPNMDDEAKQEAEAKADEGEMAADAPAEGSGAATGPDGVSSSHGSSASTAQAAASAGQGSPNSGATSSGSGLGSSSSAPVAPSQPAHTHTWVAVTSQQWHSNPVSVWVQDSAAWDEPTYSTVGVTVCWCGVENPSADHLYNHAINGERQNTHVETKRVQTGTVHHDAAGHYETQDQGWYETVTTGYQCSGCGAWQ